MSTSSVVVEPAKKRGLPWWAWSLIAGAVVVLLAVVAFVALMVIGFSAYVSHSIAETSPDQAFLEGAPQQPRAVSPLPCPDQCFDLDDANAVAVSGADLSILAIEDEIHGVGAFEPASVGDIAPAVGEDWLSVGGDGQCAFVIANAPYIPLGSDGTSLDPIMWLQTWETDSEMMDVAARTFSTTEGASAFMLDVHERVPQCAWQDLAIPSAGGLDSTLVEITAQAAIDVPDDVAAVGWVREGTPGPRWRSYVWDLQRGNLVVQVRVLTDGRILEQDVADFAELVAGRLGELAPSTQ